MVVILYLYGKPDAKTFSLKILMGKKTGKNHNINIKEGSRG